VSCIPRDVLSQVLVFLLVPRLL